MVYFTKTKPVFLLLLPVFFVLHGYIENYNFVPVSDASLLALLYIGGAFIIAAISWLFFRDFIKASLIAFIMMAYNFFYGSTLDILKSHFPGVFVLRHSFIVPVSFLFFLVVIIGLKKRKKSLTGIIFYLNLLLLLLLVVDTGWLIIKIASSKKNSPYTLATAGFTLCDTCKKPDVFLIILDEYTGNKALKEVFNFDNSAFEEELQNKGFHVIKESSSNYNYTPFSMASILNMDYLTLNMKTKGKGNLNYCYETIRDSRVVKFFKAHGYQFYNYSAFNFPGQPSLQSGSFLPIKTKLITAQTFLSKLEEDASFNIARGRFNFKSALKKVTYENFHNNEDILLRTKNMAAQQITAPKFIYAHLVMPHYPYYFNSNSVPLPLEDIVEGRESDTKNYVEYLEYCNKRILQLVDSVLTASATPPVIMLLGDHGFRHFKNKTDRAYYFMNLNAVYFPGKNYQLFYDKMTNVNQFRVVFNTLFNQQLPILKDSTIYLWN